MHHDAQHQTDHDLTDRSSLGDGRTDGDPDPDRTPPTAFRRRPAHRARVVGLAAAAVVAGAAAAAMVLPGGASTAAPAVASPDSRAAVAAEPEPSEAAHAVGGLAGTLASLLADRGAVSGLENWLPYGPAKPGSPVPTLDDGSPGRAGQLLLDGENVSVIVSPRMGAQCGPRAADNPTPNCRSVDGGFVQTGAADVTTPPGATGQASADSVVEWAAFYTGEIEVVINANDEVLPLSELVELAQDPAWTE